MALIILNLTKLQAQITPLSSKLSQEKEFGGSSSFSGKKK